MTREFKILKGKDMPFTGYRMTGSWGMYYAQSRHHWFGIAGVWGIRYSLYWGSDFNKW